VNIYEKKNSELIKEFNRYVREHPEFADDIPKNAIVVMRLQKDAETDPLTCPKCQGEMRIVSFIDQPEAIKKILQHLGLWEESHAPPTRNPPACSELVEPMKAITFDPSYGSINPPSQGRSRDSLSQRLIRLRRKLN